ncbi:MAG: site-specific DNA-methyltransferase [candidate division Zixibacteria bacterium]|nr:site-specific DNA-methyltransferase [candidate division Zixibacteria bacterium]
MYNSVNKSLDLDSNAVREQLLPHCRLQSGEIWHDEQNGHIVACGDATDNDLTYRLVESGTKPKLAVHDPPYNLVAFERRPVDEYIAWCRKWINISYDILDNDAALYVWLGADQRDHFQPLPQFMSMMADTGFESRSFVTMRNQRGYGTQKNWMAVRQELLYYTKGAPSFDVQYTDIPKAVRGYYKDVGGERTENIERSRSDCIRAGNVWIDVQQVFYRMEENVDGCLAQKPLKAIERIVQASSQPGDTVIDFFAHAGTTLLACERLGRRCLTMDIDPIFAEITIRRLEHFRTTGGAGCSGRTGWQREHPFECPADVHICR